MTKMPKLHPHLQEKDGEEINRRNNNGYYNPNKNSFASSKSNQ